MEARAACTATGACLSAGPCLASVDTARNALPDPLLGGLLDSQPSLTAAAMSNGRPGVRACLARPGP